RLRAAITRRRGRRLVRLFGQRQRGADARDRGRRARDADASQHPGHQHRLGGEGARRRGVLHRVQLMPGFYVLDAHGCQKIKGGGTGASLTDPLTIAHGGTGLTSIEQGDLLYAYATDDLRRRAIDTDEGRAPYKVLCNLGEGLANPRWGGGVIGPLGAALDRPAGTLGNLPRFCYGLAFPASAVLSGFHVVPAQLTAAGAPAA